MKRSFSAIFVASILAVAAAITGSLGAQARSGPAKLAVSIEPIAAIVSAFRTHAIVLVPSGHGNEQIQAFELSLIRNPGFTAIVNDIVVEFGNAKYQSLMDRFVAGDDLPESSLQQVWQNTTSAFPTWDSPLQEEFFRAVRDANSRLPRKDHLRVLLGDPPIDWDQIRTNEDYRPWLQQRDLYPGDLVKREVLQKHRRALVVYGQMHAQRRDLLTNFEPTGGLFGLESNGSPSVFSIWAATEADLANIQPDVAKWPIPSFAFLRGTILGAADFTAYYPYETPRFAGHNGRGMQVPREQWRQLPMEEQFDGLLYLGPKASLTYAALSPTLCADANYVEMRVRRMRLANVPQAQAERFRQQCAATK